MKKQVLGEVLLGEVNIFGKEALRLYSTTTASSKNNISACVLYTLPAPVTMYSSSSYNHSCIHSLSLVFGFFKQTINKLSLKILLYIFMYN